MRHVALLLTLWAAHAFAREGILTWAEVARLGAAASGPVTEVLVKEGDRVEKGQVLLRIDPRPYQAALETAQARLRELEPIREEAKEAWERAKALYEQQVLSEVDRKRAERAFIEADARYRAARGEEKRARIALTYTEVRAPFQGTVVKRLVHPGEVVVSRCEARPLILLARSQRLKVVLILPLEEVPAPGQDAWVAGRSGKVTDISPTRRGAAVTVLIEDPTLRPGQKVEVRFPRTQAGSAP